LALVMPLMVFADARADCIATETFFQTIGDAMIVSS
jgi:hypothetical protein